MHDKSALVTASLGVVAVDILEDDLYVDIYPSEKQPSSSGELSSPDTSTNTITDISGNVTIVKTIKSKVVKAKWLPDGDTNRLEPPTVCKGEVVRLLRYGDSEQYYWSTPYNQLDLRKLEKRTIVVSNKQSINVPEDELYNHTYSTVMDTINKKVHLRTTDTDGEYTTYDIYLDTTAGIFELVDGKNNHIMLDSTTDTLKISVNNTIDVSAGNHIAQRTNTLSIANDTTELIKTLSDFIQATSDAIGVGNLGSPVPMDGGTKSALAALKARVDSFIK